MVGAGVAVRTVGTAGALAIEMEEARESLRLRGTGKTPLPFSTVDVGVPVRGVKLTMAGVILLVRKTSVKETVLNGMFTFVDTLWSSATRL